MTDEQSFLRAINANPDDELTRKVFADWLDEHDQPDRARMFRCGVVKKYGVGYRGSEGGALTLDSGANGTHSSGWTIAGPVHEDYYEWINEFEATHPVYGRIEGDYENTLFATSEEAFQHFYENHPPHAWDYQDI